MRCFCTGAARSLGLVGLLLSGVGCVGRHSAAPDTVSPAARPQEAEQLVQRGHVAHGRGDSVRAEQYYSLALDHGYDRGTLLPELLDVCLANSRLRAALNHALPYLRQHPEDHALSYLVATIHLGLGQLDEGRRELQALLRHKPDHADAHYLLAVLEVASNVELACDHFRTYLALEPAGSRAAEVRRRVSELRSHSTIATGGLCFKKAFQ